MRIVLLTVLSTAISSLSCGGSQKSAETAADTSSLEAKGSSTVKSEDAPSPSPSGSSTGGAGSGADAAGAAQPGAPAHPAPSVTGSIDGKPCLPKIARTVGKVQKDGRIVLALDDAAADCSTTGAPQPGEARLTLLVPWQNGYKIDLAALRRSTPKKTGGEITFSRGAAGGKKEISATFKPSGTVTVVTAPTDASSVGKINIDLQSGDFMIAGDLDVLVCGPTK
jgi:hypothetical protein